MILGVMILGVVILGVSANANAHDVRIGIGLVLPPYVIQETDSGLEVDIIRQAFAEVGHRAVFVYLPNPRLSLALASGDVDGVATDRVHDLTSEVKRPLYCSVTTLKYRNFAISRLSNGHTITCVKDLEGKRVLAFHNACKHLGQEYAKAVQRAHYRELADQSLHAGMLYADRTDVLISDKRIFAYWRRELAKSFKSKEQDLAQPLVFHAIFDPMPRAVFFVEKELRDDFDKGFRTIQERGDIKTIAAQYLGSEKL